MHASCMPDLVGLCPVTWNTLSLLPWTLPVSRGGEARILGSQFLPRGQWLLPWLPGKLAHTSSA